MKRDRSSEQWAFFFFFGIPFRRKRGVTNSELCSFCLSWHSSTGLEPDFQNTDDDLDLEDGPRLQHQQLSLPQLCIAVLQRSLPRLRTANEALGVQVLELVHETLTVLTCVVGPGMWADRREVAREIVSVILFCMLMDFSIAFVTGSFGSLWFLHY